MQLMRIQKTCQKEPAQEVTSITYFVDVWNQGYGHGR